jgi:hypothetical protein
MKKVLALGLVLMVMAAPTFADLESEDVTEVWIEIEENVSISAVSATLWLSPHQTGMFEGVVEWLITANVQELNFWGVATHFYKSCDPTAPEVPPIPLIWDDPLYAMLFQLVQGNAIDPATGRLPYVGPQNVDAFEGYVCTQGLFGSSQAPPHFEQILTQRAWWNQGSETQPSGYYCAKVQAFAMVP